MCWSLGVSKASVPPTWYLLVCLAITNRNSRAAHLANTKRCVVGSSLEKIMNMIHLKIKAIVVVSVSKAAICNKIQLSDFWYRKSSVFLAFGLPKQCYWTFKPSMFKLLCNSLLLLYYANSLSWANCHQQLGPALNQLHCYCALASQHRLPLA